MEPTLGPCNCDETGMCLCAVPRTTAIRTGRPPPVPRISVSTSPTAPRLPESACSPPSDGSEKSWPSCCLTNDPSSGTPSLKYGGACTESTSGSESCCTAPPTPPDGIMSPPGNPVPKELAPFIAGPSNALPELTPFNGGDTVRTEFPHFNPELPQLSFPPEFTLLDYSPMDDPLRLSLQARSHRYAPYPQAIQTPSTSYAGPSRTSQSNQPVGQPPAFDSDTLALWDQFLREDTSNEGKSGNMTNTENVSNVPNAFQASPPPSCSCGPGSSCVSCSLNNPGYVPSDAVAALIPTSCATELDCSTLAAAMALIEEDFPAVGETWSSSLPPLPGLTHEVFPINQANAKHSQTCPGSTSLQPNDTLSELQPNPKAALEQLGLHSTLSGTCTCKQKCASFLCTAEPSTALACREVEDSFVTCAFCDTLQKASTQSPF
jgi:hypothetical protein